jgi:hypothetical protein
MYARAAYGELLDAYGIVVARRIFAFHSIHP